MATNSVVAVEFGARPEQLGLGRALTRTVALGLGLAGEVASDLELAVHEIASLLVAVAAPEAVIRCECRAELTVIEVRISARTRDRPVLDGLGWYIATTLAGEIVVHPGPDEPHPGNGMVSLIFSWPRPLG